MESNEERFRKFKEQMDMEMEERRATNQLIDSSFVYLWWEYFWALSLILVGSS